MKRREFITLLGGAAALWPFGAHAQQGRLPRVDALVLTSADAQSLGKELRDGLRDLGYVEGQNFALDFRSADGNADRLSDLAAELVRLQVDVIVAAYTPCAVAPVPAPLMTATRRDGRSRLDSEHFRCCPRTCRPPRDTLSARQTSRTGRAMPWQRDT
jgi:hypothetical protein